MRFSKYLAFTFLALGGVIAMPSAFSADVGIGAFLDSEDFLVGERVAFYVSGFNREATPRVVDVHVGVIAPNGTIYEYPNWNTALQPWLAAAPLSANLRFPATLIGNLDTFPGGLQPGRYRFATALTEPGTLNLLALSIVPFKVTSGAESRIVGGATLGFGKNVSSTFPAVLAAVGNFSRVDADVAAMQAKLRQQTPTIDHCLFHQLPGTLEALVGAANVSALDAGADLSLGSSSNGGVTLSRVATGGGGIAYGVSPNPPLGFYRAGEVYTLAGSGGPDVPAFSVSVTAPSAVTVTQPDLSTLTGIDSNQDFVLRWQGNDGVGEIEVELMGGTADDPDAIVCRFADDGEGVVPASLLAELRDALNANVSPVGNLPGFVVSGSGVSIGQGGVTLTVSRVNFDFFNNADEDASLFTIDQTLATEVAIQ